MVIIKGKNTVAPSGTLALPPGSSHNRVASACGGKTTGVALKKYTVNHNEPHEKCRPVLGPDPEIA